MHDLYECIHSFQSHLLIKFVLCIDLVRCRKTEINPTRQTTGSKLEDATCLYMCSMSNNLFMEVIADAFTAVIRTSPRFNNQKLGKRK